MSSKVRMMLIYELLKERNVIMRNDCTDAFWEGEFISFNFLKISFLEEKLPENKILKPTSRKQCSYNQGYF